MGQSKGCSDARMPSQPQPSTAATRLVRLPLLPPLGNQLLLLRLRLVPRARLRRQGGREAEQQGGWEDQMSQDNNAALAGWPAGSTQPPVLLAAGR